MPEMEGLLYKWTNYISGWQPRWFVLDKGILAYYKSQDEMHLGSKGSIKMACCEIIVHQSDQCRLDLIIPGEQHFYVKGATPAERQQWLVALGSSKACLTNSKTLEKAEESTGSLKSKMSELRLYKDLLMQQVHAVKTATDTPDKPDMEQINDATSLLSATCDTFIRTLQDCMKIADDTFTSHMSHGNISEGVLPPSLASPTDKTMTDGTPLQSMHSKRTPKMLRSQSVDRYQPPPSKTGVRTTFKNLEELASRPKTIRARSSSGSSSSPQSMSAPATPTSTFNADGLGLSSPTTTPSTDNHHGNSKRPSVDLSKDVIPLENRPLTIFTTMKYSFVDIELPDDKHIPTAPFLEAFRNMLPIFDALGATTFAPVKMDILGNIRKVNQKYMTDPNGFSSVQNIINQEIRSNSTRVKNSATDALLWLKRTLEYTHAFLEQIIQGEKDLSIVAGNAYTRSLKKFHGWVARGVFALLAKTVPYYEDFIALLAVSRTDYEQPNFEKYILEDLRAYANAMMNIIEILCQFYTDNDLDFQEQV